MGKSSKDHRVKVEVVTGPREQGRCGRDTKHGRAAHRKRLRLVIAILVALVYPPWSVHFPLRYTKYIDQ
jgi:hypothetical protein